MNRKVHVLKKGQTVEGGSFTLPISYSAAPIAEAAGLTASPVASVPQQARVIESNSEYAILEVICSCGNKMHIQCNYGNLTSQ